MGTSVYKYLLILLTLIAFTGCGGGSSPSGNNAPVANAGPDQNVTTDTNITLDGSGSSDANGGALSYLWRFLSVPVDSVITTNSLSNSAIVNPNFTPDVNGNYIIELVVNDGVLNSNADTVTITAAGGNSAPVANAGPNQNVVTGNMVTLDGTGSSDANNDGLTYAWTIVAVPALSSLVAVDMNLSLPSPQFTPDVDGGYAFSLVVNDGAVNSTPDNVLITASSANVAPVANAGPDDAAGLGVPGFLDGTGSYDDNGDALTYLWTITSAPTGTSLSDPTTAQPLLYAPDFGPYVLSLVVNDGNLSSPADAVIYNFYYILYTELGRLTQEAFHNFQGNEFVSSTTINSSLLNAAVDITGGAFCHPVDPYVTPAASSTPPATVYGCDNWFPINFSVAATSVTFAVVIPELYIDYQMNNIEGYAQATSVNYTFTIELSNQGNGVYRFGAITSSSVSIPPANFNAFVLNSLLQTDIDGSIDLVRTTLESEVNSMLDNTIMGPFFARPDIMDMLVY